MEKGRTVVAGITIILFCIVIASAPSAAGTQVINAAAVARANETVNLTAWSGPRITDAIIMPPDVHVGDVQNLSVTAYSTEPVVAAVARIETDKGIVALPLQPTNVTDSAEFRFMLGERVVRRGAKSWVAAGLTRLGVLRAEPLTQTYAASWTVRDTHDTYYNTTFAVTDAGGASDSVMLEWSDACGIPAGGSWTMTSSCTLYSADGIDNGNATLNSPYVLTLNGQTFAWNSGKQITINTGSSITVGTGQLRQTNLWMIDSDSDGCPASSTQYAQDSAPAGGRRRYLISNPSCDDCDDGNAGLQSGNTCYVDGDGDGYGAGSQVETCGSCTGGYSSRGDDCYDSSSAVYPGNGGWYTSSGPHGWDYDCSGIVEQQYTAGAYANCQNSGGTCSLAMFGASENGYGPLSCGGTSCASTGGAPFCGNSFTYYYGFSCSGTWGSCTITRSTNSQTQGCH